MVQIDIPAAYGIGHFFADAAFRQLATRDPDKFANTWLKHAIFQTFFFSWIPVYFLINYFGWETTHMWWHRDAGGDYSYFIPVFMLLFFLAGNLGFLTGTWMVRNGKRAANRAVYISILVFSAIWILGQYERTFKLGSYHEWTAGAAPWFWEDTNFVIMLVTVMVIWIGGLVYFWRNLRKREH